HEFADGAFRALWSLGVPPALAEYNREWRVWGPETALGQLPRTKQTVQVVDAREGRAYANHDPGRIAAIELGGVRTFVIVPLLKEGVLIGDRFGIELIAPCGDGLLALALHCMR